MKRKITIPVIAMADIAFLLLIFLLVTSITSTKKSVHINLPKTDEISKVGMKKTLDIFISKDGEYFWSGNKIKPDELNLELNTKTALNKNIIILIHGDWETRYEYVDGLIRILQANSLKNCVFVSKKQNKM